MAKASSQQSESKEKTTKSTAKKAPAKKAAPKKETAKAKSAAASKKKAVEAEAAEAHDLEEDDTENILESDVEPTDLHDDHHDVKASDLTDESLLEGVPEEELKAAAEITVPKVSHKSQEHAQAQHPQVFCRFLRRPAYGRSGTHVPEGNR